MACVGGESIQIFQIQLNVSNYAQLSKLYPAIDLVLIEPRFV